MTHLAKVLPVKTVKVSSVNACASRTSWRRAASPRRVTRRGCAAGCTARSCVIIWTSPLSIYPPSTVGNASSRSGAQVSFLHTLQTRLQRRGILFLLCATIGGPISPSFPRGANPSLPRHAPPAAPRNLRPPLAWLNVFESCNCPPPMVPPQAALPFTPSEAQQTLPGGRRHAPPRFGQPR